MDFTLKTYKTLLETFVNRGYTFLTFGEYIEKDPRSPSDPTDRVTILKDGENQSFSPSVLQSFSPLIILRHDVDLKPGYSLKTAQIEHSLGITGSYYFRSIPQSLDPLNLCLIANLGHEIGYHYEDLTFTHGDIHKGIQSFGKHLEELRKYYPVKTAVMHGSPRSPWDSKDLWKHYDYHDFGIIGEPYLDIDFSKVLYLTDTGRRWDGEKSSVRDKVKGENLRDQYRFHSTFDIIRAAEKHELPDQIMITIHPQRWTDKPGHWLRELVSQNVKNVVKRWFFVKKGFRD